MLLKINTLNSIFFVKKIKFRKYFKFFFYRFLPCQRYVYIKFLYRFSSLKV